MNILKWFKKEEKVTEGDLRSWHVQLVQLRQKVWKVMEVSSVSIKNKKSKLELDNLFTNINHGRELKKLLPNAVLISGEDDRKSRDEAKKKLLEQKDTIVLASDIWSTGVDIPAIKTLILAGSSVSSVKIIQKIGRSTRNDKNTDKITAEIIDFYQIDNPLSIKQSKKRKNVYENILKIPVKIIK